MLDMKLLENEPEHVKERLALRGEVPGIDELLELLAQRRHDIARLQEAQHERNEASNAMKSASKEEIQAKEASSKRFPRELKKWKQRNANWKPIFMNVFCSSPIFRGLWCPKGQMRQTMLKPNGS